MSTFSDEELDRLEKVGIASDHEQNLLLAEVRRLRAELAVALHRAAKAEAKAARMNTDPLSFTGNFELEKDEDE